MIDLHAHVLPGIDDGPRTMDEAIGLVRQAHHDGIRTIVATPHAYNGLYAARKEQVLETLASLREEVARLGIPVDILPGMEAYVHVDLVRYLDLGKILTIADGPYVCLELPSTQVPLCFQDLLFDLRLGGYVPLIIHPERNATIQQSPGLMENFAEMGAMGIITAGSLTGRFGATAKRTAVRLIKAGWARAVATDAHHLSRRPAILSEARAVLEKLVGTVWAQEMVVGVPGKVISGRRSGIAEAGATRAVQG